MRKEFVPLLAVKRAGWMKRICTVVVWISGGLFFYSQVAEVELG